TARKTAASGKAAGKTAGGTGPRGRPGCPNDARLSAAAMTWHRANDHDENHREYAEGHDQNQNRAPRRRWIRSSRRALLPFLSVPRKYADDVINAARDTTWDIIGAKPRDDRVLNDELGDRISERALQAVAHLNAYLALAWHDDQQHAVVLALLSDAPAAAELKAELLHRGALQRSQGDDHELVGGLGVEVRELLGERRPRCQIEDVGLVHHPAAERGQDECKSRPDGEQEESEQKQREACAPATVVCPSLPFTPGSGGIDCKARSGLALARCAHGATIRTSPAAAWSRLRRR